MLSIATPVSVVSSRDGSSQSSIRDGCGALLADCVDAKVASVIASRLNTHPDLLEACQQLRARVRYDAQAGTYVVRESVGDLIYTDDPLDLLNAVLAKCATPPASIGGGS